MKYLSLDLTALSPLAIRADHAPGSSGNSPYIAGTALMGSLAAVHRRYHPEQTGEFEQLFLSGQIQYPNLYPASRKYENPKHKETPRRTPQSEATPLPIYPLPMTAQSCKRFAGFAGDGREDPLHGVNDSLLDWAVFELGGGQSSDSLKALREHKECKFQYREKRCEKAMHHFGGFYRRTNGAQGGQSKVETGVGTRLQTHTGIDRGTGTVQEGILYNRQVFEEQARFSGIVRLPDELARPFVNFIEQVGTSGLVRVGTGRTRGLGKVRLSAGALADELFGRAAFEQRLQLFDAELRQTAEKYLKKRELAPFYFAFTLHAPAILRDHLLRYRGSIDEETLAELLNFSQEKTTFSKGMFKRLYQAADTRRVTGWNELWGTPKVNEFAIETGSVFLFSAQVENVSELYEALFQLEQRGIGQRRAEGFGRVCVSDPFHVEVRLS